MNSTKNSFPTQKPTLSVLGSKKFRGFTLIELIVVITILAILGTIGFLSIWGYSSKARDSARVGDVAQITKSLDLSVITAGDYPTPDNAFSVTFSGGVLWYQGTVGSRVLQVFRSSISWGGLNDAPIDPLTNKEYTYSELAEGKAYQIKVDYEGELNQTAIDTSLINQAVAAPGDPTIAYIRGNYQGLAAKTTTGGIVYVLAIPSIITSSGTTATGSLRIENNTLSGTLLLNGRNLRNATTYNPNTRPNGGVVFSGATLPINDTTNQITNMINAIKTAYTGSDLASTANIASLIATTGTASIQTLGATILKDQLGGSAVSGGGGGQQQQTPTFACGTSTVTDADNNTYATVQIGTQCWMKSNLRTTKNPDGSPITKGNATHGGGGWGTDVRQYSCPPNASNNGEDCAAATTYGMLYQWSAAMNNSTTNGAQGICPAGWHVPTDTEWKTLVESQATANCESSTGWQCPNAGSRLAGGGTDWLAYTDGIRQNASNVTRPEFGSSGFDARPSGYRVTNSNYYHRTDDTYLWSSTQVDASSAWLRGFGYSLPSVHRGSSAKAYGIALRCVQG